MCEGDRASAPCKVEHVQRWLDATGRRREDFERTIFYSDSRNDLPLLEWADEAIAVDPDESCAPKPMARGWRDPRAQKRIRRLTQKVRGVPGA